ncbi:MAG: hypothetical protein ABSG23_10910 [Terriglobales bacterium]|jgi:hypothetical protein
MTYKDKIDVAIEMLKEQGHTVEAQVRGKKGTFWFEVDRRMLVSSEEMQNLADGVYSLTELEELYKKRRQAENAKAAGAGS